MTDNLPTSQIPGGEGTGAAPSAAPSPAEPVAPATPSAPLADVEIRKLTEKYENDIRALKSNSDKKLHEVESRAKTRLETLERELQNLRMASMDEDERKTYESQLAIERQRDIETELARTRQEAQDFQAKMSALQYFLNLGVPANELALDQGYDVLFNSGMGWISSQLAKKQQAATSQPTAPSTPPVQPTTPTPPPVATATTGVPNIKPTWKDLHAKLGTHTDEEVYRLFELGLISGDIIPD